MSVKKLLVLFTFVVVASLVLFGCGGGLNEDDEGTPLEEDDFPSRPITIVVGFNPGGGMDVMSRALAPEMSKVLGVDVVVENMPGANSAVAAEYVNNQPADGYTLFAVSSATSTFPALATSDITYNEFGLLGIPFNSTPCFTVSADSPYEDMGDLIEAWKAGGTTASNSGIGGIWHIPQVISLDAVDGETQYVPYEGGKPAALAVAQGDVDWGTSDAVEAAEFIKDGLSRPLAVFAAEPYELPGYGEIPPITDWIPELQDMIVAGAGWRGLGYKKGIPENRLEKLYEAVETACEADSVVEFAENSGLNFMKLFREDADVAWETTTKVQSWLLYDLDLAERSPEEVNIPRP